MDEHREEREELDEFARDDDDDRRQQATADEYMREKRAVLVRVREHGSVARMSVDREQVRRDSSTIESDVVTVRGFLDYPTASGRDVYLNAVEALDRLALDAHRAEQAERERDGYLSRLDEVNVERQRQEVRAITAERERDEARAQLKGSRRIAQHNAAQLVVVPALVEALRHIKQNAEAWHGPEPTEPQQGHHRALAVIATWCDDALARWEQAQGETP